MIAHQGLTGTAGYSEAAGDPLVQAGLNGNAKLATLLLERGGADPNSGFTSCGVNSEETAAIGAIKRDLEPADDDGDDQSCLFAYDEDEDEEAARVREDEYVYPASRRNGAESAVPVLRALLRGGWSKATDEGAHVVAADGGHLAALKVLVEEGPGVDLEAKAHCWPGSMGANRVGTALYIAPRSGGGSRWCATCSRRGRTRRPRTRSGGRAYGLLGRAGRRLWWSCWSRPSASDNRGGFGWNILPRAV